VRKNLHATFEITVESARLGDHMPKLL
jgi:hypothetical protein